MKRENWEPLTLHDLKKLYGTVDIVTLSKILNRTTGSIRKKAFEMGLTRKNIIRKKN
jgi:hypothetical protein